MQPSRSTQTTQPSQVASNRPNRPWRSSDSNLLLSTIPAPQEMAPSSLPPAPECITMNHDYPHLHPQRIVADLDVLPVERRNQMELGNPTQSSAQQRLRSHRGYTVISGILYTREMLPVAVSLDIEIRDHRTFIPTVQRQPSSVPETAPLYPSAHSSAPRHDRAEPGSDPRMRQDQHRIEIDTNPSTNNPQSVYELPASPLDVQRPISPSHRLLVTADDETDVFEAPSTDFRVNQGDGEQIDLQGSAIFGTDHQISVGPFQSLRAMDWWRDGVEIDSWDSVFRDEDFE